MISTRQCTALANSVHADDPAPFRPHLNNFIATPPLAHHLQFYDGFYNSVLFIGGSLFSSDNLVPNVLHYPEIVDRLIESIDDFARHLCSATHRQ